MVVVVVVVGVVVVVVAVAGTQYGVGSSSKGTGSSASSSLLRHSNVSRFLSSAPTSDILQLRRGPPPGFLDDFRPPQMDVSAAAQGIAVA